MQSKQINKTKTIKNSTSNKKKRLKDDKISVFSWIHQFYISCLYIFQEVVFWS